MLVMLHFFEGTQRLLEPVSKMTLNDCPGVPVRRERVQCQIQLIRSKIASLRASIAEQTYRSK